MPSPRRHQNTYNTLKTGNIIAGIGIAVGFLGFIMLPLFNFHELPFIADTGYIKGGGWILLAQSGIFKWTGLSLLITGIALFTIARMLPKKYWANLKQESTRFRIKSGKKKKIKPKKRHITDL